MCDQKNGDDVDELSASDDSEPEEGLSSAPFDPELDHDDEDEDEDDEGGGAALSAAAGLGAQSSFSLRGGGSAFSHRSSSIFQGLDSVARLSSSSSSPTTTTSSSSTTTTSSSTTSSDGVFARPRPPSRRPSAPPSSGPSPPKKRAGVPDYLVHPERWTHYSLEEVPETCERSNSRAALLYLSGLQQRKEEQQQQEEQEQEESRGDSSRDLQQKMIFSRVRAGGSGVSAADQPPAVRGREKETRLSHLEEQEEEQEEAAGRRMEQRKRGAVEEEQEQEDRGEEQQESPAFTSFRRTKQKNYRRSSAGEES